MAQQGGLNLSFNNSPADGDDPAAMRDAFRVEARSRSFMPVEGAKHVNRTVNLLILCMICATEGADGALFPANTKAIEKIPGEREWGITLQDMGTLSLVQSLAGVGGGPFFGIIASRGTVHRRDILFIGVIMQGTATLLMCWSLNMWILVPMRFINGVALSSLRPICNSIVGDLYGDDERGAAFGWIMLALNFGSAIFGIIAVTISEETIVGIPGWQFSFLMVGSFTVALSFPVRAFLQVPAVVPDLEKMKEGVAGEFKALYRLFQMWTFAGCVFQGCFGLIPWKAFEFRTFFFQLNGIGNALAGTINSSGQFAAGVGNALGGYIGDYLATWSQTAGRIVNAELSIFLGIPVALFTFLIQPTFEKGGTAAVAYFMSLTILLGLVATWVPTGTNSPLLCTIVSESDRALVLAWQTSLEGAIGSLGPVLFNMFAQMFGYNAECRKDTFKAENSELCNNASAAGTSLFLCTVIPWGIAGMIYATLFYSYPRDLEVIVNKRMEQLANEQEMGGVAPVEVEVTTGEF